uniref:Uncharacterized protein n=1 Tax=Avena sativa TaxID=4498 RepID=A0ACD5Z385_AVESA
MDANWQPVQGSNPPAGVDPNAPAAAGDDWRAHLQPEARGRIVNRIMETLRKHLPVSLPEGLNKLQRIAVRFEEKIYNAATSQSDYLRKVSLKMLSMETRTPQAPGNAYLIPNQNNPGQGTLYSKPSDAYFINWQPVQVSNPPAGVDPNAPAAGDDWRAHLQPEARSRIVNRIMETLRKHLPVSGPEGLNELQKIAVRFEEKIYNAATNQPDYLRKVSLKMLSMETRTTQAPGNAYFIPNQNNPGQGWPR